MRQLRRTSSRHWQRAATLVEALAGMAILGTLLVSVLLANARFQRQRGRTTMRLEAVRAADRLLEEWWQNRDEFPREDQGTVSGDTSWQWRTTVVANDEAGEIGCEVVALEIFPAGETGVAVSAAESAVCRVEVLLPLKADEE